MEEMFPAGPPTTLLVASLRDDMVALTAGGEGSNNDTAPKPVTSPLLLPPSSPSVVVGNVALALPQAPAATHPDPDPPHRTPQPSPPYRPRLLRSIALMIGIVLLLLSDAELADTLAHSLPSKLRGWVLMTELSPSPFDEGSATSSADTDVAKSCECHEGVGHYLLVTPCAGLVNQHYAIAHTALLAGAVGADVVVEDMSTRNSFTENVANYVEFKRLPASDFQTFPVAVHGYYTVSLLDRLPPHLGTCSFPEENYHRQNVRLDDVSTLASMLDGSCGIRVGCPFYGVTPSTDDERQFLIDTLRALVPSNRLRALADAIIVKLVAAAGPGIGGYTAVHLRLEPDMNGGKMLPVPRDDIVRELERLGVAPNSPVYVASGVAAEIYDELPSGYVWFYRDQLLAGGGGEEEGFVAEQMALVDLWVCRHANFFIGDVRSTFSVATAVLKDMQGIGWYYGTLRMWAGDAVKLGLPPQ
jgi:hypothetical protein